MDTNDHTAEQKPPRFLSVPEAAAELGVSTSRLRRAATLGQLRMVLIGKRKVIPRSELVRLERD